MGWSGGAGGARVEKVTRRWDNLGQVRQYLWLRSRPCTDHRSFYFSNYNSLNSQGSFFSDPVLLYPTFFFVVVADLAHCPTVPFGGFKQSGIGRELGEYALANYTAFVSFSFLPFLFYLSLRFDPALTLMMSTITVSKRFTSISLLETLSKSENRFLGSRFSSEPLLRSL